MELKRMALLVLEITVINITLEVAESDSMSRGKSSEIERKTSLPKMRAVKSIQSEDGDIIDCIGISDQPAFDHPALRNHTIQMTPSYDPTMEMKTTTTTATKRKEDSPITITSQIWRRSGSCPKGTIPIRRLPKKNDLKENAINKYGRKKATFLHHAKQFNDSKISNLQQANRSVAILHTEGFSYLGAKGDIKVWNPYVESDDEYSTSQICLRSGPHFDYEAIESGWAVKTNIFDVSILVLLLIGESLEKDGSEHNASATADASMTTGCFDLTCPGFVQTSNEIALGAAIYPISLPTGLPYQIILYIYQDPDTSNWWLQYGEKMNIGYWPPHLFSMIRHHAETVQWGGEVYSSKVGTQSHPHTATAMGNGNYPDIIFDNSGYVKRIRVHENYPGLKFPEWVNAYSDEYDCYEVYYISDYVEDPEFYYGGPGRNPQCP
ncbi:unnamed protein product [Ilex paraguariensis]|uniref:Neprosin PEP catalytic domain-containing protein n=1 Tax=Ilex paraguariensis TaxID=185542 RepID=A0ABC8RIE4_9AQUA